MSEFIAEARVLITPDTTKFRIELERELAALTSKPVTVPVTTQVVGTANTALAENTALVNANTAATERNAAAQQQVGAASTRSAIATKELGTQQALAATTASKLALAQEAVAGASSAVAAAQVQFTRAQAATVAAEAELAAALKLKNIALIDAAAQSLRVTSAYEAETLAALRTARAEAIHARTLDSVGTAGIANTASLLGLRGAVLTAGAAFLGATVAFQSASRAIKGAVDTTEELNKSVEVFGSSAEQIKDFAETTATSLGISNVEALRAAGIFGNLFRSINIAAPAAADMSEELVRLAADLASFNNADPSQVLENLRSGLVGEPEPLRKFGIFLSQARAQQEALNNTGKESIKQLTQQEIVQARFNIILRDSVIAQGDFARTSDSLANQTRLLKAQLADLGAEFGAVLIPVLQVATGFALEYVQVIRDATDVTKKFAAAIPGIGANIPGTNTKVSSLVKNMAEFSARSIALGPTLGVATFALSKLRDSADDATTKVNDLAHAFPGAGRAALDAAKQINVLKDVLRELSGLEVKQLEIQTGLAPGGRAAEEANLQAQIEADKRAVEAAASGSAARKKALEELRRDQADLAALQKQDAREAEDAANDIKAAAEKARRAQEEADRAFIALLGERREDQARRAARAQETAGLQDDIRSQNVLQRIIQQQIKKIRERVKSEQERKAAIRELRIALIASRDEERKLRQQQIQQQQEQIDTVQQLNIDIAIEKGNTSAAERAIRARINRLNKQIKAAKGDQVKVKQLILERERLRNQLKELRKEEDKGREDARKQAAAFFFEQLQAQQGFAANLLGNLIPAGQTAGLVGTPSPQVNIRAQAAAAEGRAQVGPTSGQAEKQSFILQKILIELRKLNGSYDAPEAIHNKKVGGAAMDYSVL